MKFESIYEKLRPQIIGLGMMELAWISYWLLTGDNVGAGYALTAYGWVLTMLIWLYFLIKLSRNGIFLAHSEKFSNLLGFFSVILLPVVLFGSTEVGRHGVLTAATRTPDLHLVLIHCLRLLSIGTIIKYVQKQLPLHFVIFGSLPDLLFALSAVGLAFLDPGMAENSGFYFVWHSIGIAVFFGAGISMFLSVPSPIRIFNRKPDTALVFQYPMALAPNFTVPLFAVAHLFALLKLV
jgi:hypothetical protein